jgi:hypothetical protein
MSMAVVLQIFAAKEAEHQARFRRRRRLRVVDRGRSVRRERDAMTRHLRRTQRDGSRERRCAYLCGRRTSLDVRLWGPRRDQRSCRRIHGIFTEIPSGRHAGERCAGSTPASPSHARQRRIRHRL